MKRTTSKTTGRNRPLLNGLMVLSLSIVFLQGCGDPTLTRLTSKLATSGSGCTRKVSTFYENLNKAHHQMYIDELKAEPAAELPEGVERPKRSGLTAEYSDEAILVRVKTASVIESYCTEIDHVVNAKSVARTEEAIGGFSKSVQSIGGEISKLSAVASAFPVGAVAALAAPLATIGELGLKGVFTAVRENWAAETIVKVDKDFEKVATALEKDCDNSARDAKDRATHLARLLQRQYDKKAERNASADDLARLRSELSAAGKFQQSVASDNPAFVFSEARESFHQLANWAVKKTEKKNWQVWRK
ncbi:MAG: hypothetical protein C0473_00600 [Cyanobacteria bacterium DS3.002]|nr:hypothetical protein [Cyanobacteria bacterium DS3.002]MBA4049458.1 hypothetical protein [Cyanobacteria bacterium DS2.008]MBA4074711.1 hypothetical protein [Cyanobacteria bacterium PR.023]